jgi:hypothetical protein
MDLLGFRGEGHQLGRPGLLFLLRGGLEGGVHFVYSVGFSADHRSKVLNLRLAISRYQENSAYKTIHIGDNTFLSTKCHKAL